jgi:hypothetical protein
MVDIKFVRRQLATRSTRVYRYIQVCVCVRTHIYIYIHTCTYICVCELCWNRVQHYKTVKFKMTALKEANISHLIVRTRHVHWWTFTFSTVTLTAHRRLVYKQKTIQNHVQVYILYIFKSSIGRYLDIHIVTKLKGKPLKIYGLHVVQCLSTSQGTVTDRRSPWMTATNTIWREEHFTLQVQWV